jgi:hypothetical protein
VNPLHHSFDSPRELLPIQGLANFIQLILWGMTACFVLAKLIFRGEILPPKSDSIDHNESSNTYSSGGSKFSNHVNQANGWIQGDNNNTTQNFNENSSKK